MKHYLERIGATTADITPKKERGKRASDQADADVIAAFEQLNVIVYIQVKKHEDVSDAWAVTQVDNYRKWKTNRAYMSGYEHLAWVVSTGESLSDDAKAYAEASSVRLINGSEFAERLLDAGISGMTLKSE